jgi:hypothetical protein
LWVVALANLWFGVDTDFAVGIASSVAQTLLEAAS